MTTPITTARRCIEKAFAEHGIPGTVRCEVTVDEVTVTVTDIPFVHHGMQFKRIAVLHFTARLQANGTFRTCRGDLDWVRGESSRTEQEVAVHDTLEAAARWLAEQAFEHAR